LGRAGWRTHTWPWRKKKLSGFIYSVVINLNDNQL
jgi:hypothetical protein